MLTLFIWALVWMVVSVRKIKDGAPNKLYWQTHLAWSIVNVGIAIYSVITLLRLRTYTYERAVDMKNIVAINILLDIGYIAVALLLLRSKNLKLHLVARALVVQALFLIVLDSVIVLYFLSVL